MSYTEISSTNLQPGQWIIFTHESRGVSKQLGGPYLVISKAHEMMDLYRWNLKDASNKEYDFSHRLSCVFGLGDLPSGYKVKLVPTEIIAKLLGCKTQQQSCSDASSSSTDILPPPPSSASSPSSLSSLSSYTFLTHAMSLPPPPSSPTPTSVSSSSSLSSSSSSSSTPPESSSSVSSSSSLSSSTLSNESSASSLSETTSWVRRSTRRRRQPDHFDDFTLDRKDSKRKVEKVKNVKKTEEKNKKNYDHIIEPQTSKTFSLDPDLITVENTLAHRVYVKKVSNCLKFFTTPHISSTLPLALFDKKKFIIIPDESRDPVLGFTIKMT